MAFVFFLLYLVLTYIRPFEFYPELGHYRMMLVVGTLGLMTTVAALPFTRFTFRAKQIPLLAGFALWIALSRMFALHWIGGGVDALSTFSITLVLFVLAVFSLQGERALRTALTMVVLLSLVLVAQAFLAVNFGTFHDLLVMTETQASGLALERARGTGFMKDPNDLAQSLVMAIPFVALWWRRGSPLENLFRVVIPTGILLYGVYLTHSRGALISLLVILFMALLPKLGAFLSGFAMTGAVVSGILVLALGGRGFGMDQSATNRLEAWSIGLQLLKQHPLSGVGFGMFHDFNELTAHNSFVLCFAELGFPGYFIWTSLLAITLLELNAVRKAPVNNDSDLTLRRLARSIQVGLFAFLVSGWFLSRTYVPTLYLLIAFAIAVVDMARRAGKTIGPFSFPVIGRHSLMAIVASIFLVYLQIKIQIR
jgi:O-antigen ligase